MDAMIHPLGVLSFLVLGALSPGTCRPFDRNREGFVIGEGAAMLLLESEELARARGANILARVLGAGSSVDAHNVTAPHPEGKGAELSMRRAMKEAGLVRVDHVNAHGTGTPLGDRAEAAAIARVLGPEVSVSSIKGAIGHCIAAAGAVEAAACIAALAQGWSPGTAGLEDPEDLGINAQAEPQQDHPQTILSNSFGFGGQNTSLIFGRA
jgi:3-oxoacyl-[acyl-carrier-protein] synthase II